MPRIQVCLTPDQLQTFDLRGATVVVVDVLRASTTICSILQADAEAVFPAESVDECGLKRAEGCLCAGEQQGQQVVGFDFGNSPLVFDGLNLRGQRVAIRTTNGTRALRHAAELGAGKLLMGGFANHSQLAAYLQKPPKPTLVLCSGWNNQLNAEDTVYAGLLVRTLEATHQPTGDAAWLARAAAEAYRLQGAATAAQWDHVQRLEGLDITQDVAACLELDRYPQLPIYRSGWLERV